MEHLKSLIDDKTRAILVNSPSNPCGQVFSRAHQLEIIKIAEAYKLPIVSDEVYFGLVYDEESEFVSMGHLTKDVPIICCSSLSKTHCLPGWRIGWIIVYNNHGYFDKVLEGLRNHSEI